MTYSFKIPPRLLKYYGTYKIIFNASMHVINGALVTETEAKLEGYFYIKQCDLKAKIVGGMGKAMPASCK